jgi:hypothetical protein
MDFNHIKKVANNLSKLIDDSEKVSLHLFSSKLNKASEAYPEDQTIGQMADITSRMANGKKMFISRAEIKELYNKLYSRNTKFAEIFSSELGQIEKTIEPAKYNRESDDSGLNALNVAYDKIVDPTLANALNSAFGNKTKGYTDTIASAAKAMAIKACQTSKVDVLSGNEDFILCRASYETPKGQTSVFVPVEVVAGKVLIPSVFICNAGSVELSKKSLVDYVVANAGNKLNITEDVVFAAIKGMKSNVSEISDVDLALTKLHTQKETKAEYTGSNSVLFQKVAAEDKKLVVNTPGYKDKEVETFAKAFDTSSGVAEFSFGKDLVIAGKNVIVNKLAAMGIKDNQISVYGSDDKQIVYAVSLNAGRVAFRVPVKVVAKKVIAPELLISNGAIESFSKEGLENLFKKNDTDYKVAAVASALYGLKASELVQTVRDAMVEENFAKAEDALNILSQGTDDLAYKTAFDLYTKGLGGVKVAETSKCKMIVRNASSSHPLCGHTGLPLHKVYQDKNGNCLPDYRKGMSESYEGGSFMNSKILF